MNRYSGVEKLREIDEEEERAERVVSRSEELLRKLMLPLFKLSLDERSEEEEGVESWSL